MIDGLPDVLGPHPEVLFCGTVIGQCAVERGHHYAGGGDAFWQLLNDAGFTPRRLSVHDDITLPSFGLGLTSLVVADTLAESNPFGVPALVARVETHQPAWVAFTGKRAADLVAKALGHAKPPLGPQTWTIGEASVFVLPSSSSANQRRDYDGRPNRLDWWRDLAAVVRSEQ